MMVFQRFGNSLGFSLVPSIKPFLFKFSPSPPRFFYPQQRFKGATMVFFQGNIIISKRMNYFFQGNKVIFKDYHCHRIKESSFIACFISLCTSHWWRSPKKFNALIFLKEGCQCIISFCFLFKPKQQELLHGLQDEGKENRLQDNQDKELGKDDLQDLQFRKFHGGTYEFPPSLQCNDG